MEEYSLEDLIPFIVTLFSFFVGYIVYKRTVFLEEAKKTKKESSTIESSKEQIHENKTETIVEKCGFCNMNEDESETPFKACGQCQVVFYCSQECQLKHWKKSHKINCQVNNNKNTLKKLQKDIIKNKNVGLSKSEEESLIREGLEGFKDEEDMSSKFESNEQDDDHGIKQQKIQLKQLISSNDLELPSIPGWPLRKEWPISPDKLLIPFKLSRYTYRYPGYNPTIIISDENLKFHENDNDEDKKRIMIEKWNKLVLTNEARKWENTENPLKFISMIEPYVKGDFPIPTALDALSRLYWLASLKWNDKKKKRGKKNTNEEFILEPDELHKSYFAKSVELMYQFADTNELQCELAIGELLLDGNTDYNFEPNIKKGLFMLNRCCERGGCGKACLRLHLYSKQLYERQNSDDYTLFSTMIYYARIAAEQEQIPIACLTMEHLALQLQGSSKEEEDDDDKECEKEGFDFEGEKHAKKWKLLSDQMKSNENMTSIMDDDNALYEACMKICRPKDEVVWSRATIDMGALENQ